MASLRYKQSLQLFRSGICTKFTGVDIQSYAIMAGPALQRLHILRYFRQIHDKF